MMKWLQEKWDRLSLIWGKETNKIESKASLTLFEIDSKLGHAIAVEGKCPDCGAKNSMLTGPRGGMSINLMCENCGHEFNFCEISGYHKITERISSKWDKERNWAYRLSSDWKPKLHREA